MLETAASQKNERGDSFYTVCVKNYLCVFYNYFATLMHKCHFHRAIFESFFLKIKKIIIVDA